METKTCFDLTRATENWRQELACQAGLTPDTRRELETHLHDTVAELQQRGLNDEESFWLARRRLGQIPQLALEFTKASPAELWRQRVLWMAIALVGSYVFMTWKDLLASWVNQADWIAFLYLLPLLVLIASVVMIRRGRLPCPNRIEQVASWKAACSLLAILAVTLASALVQSRYVRSDNMISIGYNIGMIVSWFANAVWPVMMVLILLFTLRRNHPRAKHA